MAGLTNPPPPVVLDRVLADPARFEELVATNGPFPSLQQKVMGSAVESAAITGEWVTPEMEAEARDGGTRSVSPTASFRSYWLRGGQPRRPGVEWLAEHPPFLDAARRLFGAEIVRPDEVYVNAQGPQPPRPGSCHVDIPRFRGMGRRDYPVWLLTTMGRSGLFERWRVRVATAVCWFYDGPGGTYTYWPDGPDAPPRTTRHPFANTAVVGANDQMLHRGDGAGPPGSVAPEGVTLASELVPVPGEQAWAIVDDGAELARYDRAQVRFALSWSAEVFGDDAERRRVDEHDDDLDLDTVVARLLADLWARGHRVAEPADPLGDVGFVAALARAYRVVPRWFPTAEETALVAEREAAISAGSPR